MHFHLICRLHTHSFQQHTRLNPKIELGEHLGLWAGLPEVVGPSFLQRGGQSTNLTRRSHGGASNADRGPQQAGRSHIVVLGAVELVAKKTPTCRESETFVMSALSSHTHGMLFALQAHALKTKTKNKKTNRTER